MIRRGDTKQLYINFPYTWSDVTSCYVTFKQNGRIIKEFNKGQLTYNASSSCIIVSLSQMDTLAFSEVGIPADPSKSLVYMQIRGALSTGEIFSSEPFKDRIEDVLKGDLI